MRKIKKNIASLLKYGALISSLGFIGAILIQIYARFFLESAPSWTEEAARFFFIYAMSFAAGLAMKDGYYVHFDILYNKMGAKQKRTLNIIVSSLSLTLFILFTFFALKFVALGFPEHSPSLGLTMAIAFSSMIIMGVFISFFALLDILKKLRK